MFGKAGPKRNRRKPEGRAANARKWRMKLPQLNWRRWGGVAAAVASVAAVLLLIRFALDQPIEKIAIEGRFQRVSPLDVEKAVRDFSRGEGLVAVDLDAVGAAVRRLSWVDTVAVRRSWPRGLSVFVVEQVPVARWGETGLLNTRGELFVNDARHVPTELPELTGPPGSERSVTQRYLAAQGRLVEAGMRLSSARLDPRGAWEFRLDNGVVLRLGRRQVDERFDRFMHAASRLVAVRAADIDYIDLRYTNGFAVGWRTGRENRTSG
jgi:cell division protein FtsQ